MARSVRAAAAVEAAIDRTGSPGLPVEAPPTENRRRLLLWITFAAFGFGVPTFSAIAFLLGGSPGGPGDSEAGWDEFIALALMGAAAAVGSLICLVPWRPADRIRPSWRAQLLTFPVYIAIVFVTVWLMRLLGEVTGVGTNSYASAAGTSKVPEWLRGADSALAGPAEELTLMALLVTVGRGRNWRWGTIVLIAVAVRVPFHLYYGWPALSFVLWAALVVLLYRRTGALLAIVLAHSAWNLADAFAPRTGSPITLQGAVAAIGAVIVVVFCARAVLRQRAATGVGGVA